MIRGPILPQQRDSLWGLVSARLDTIEHGLNLVLTGLDCGSGQFGQVDGLARDASGAPVLVLLATDGDSLLPARVFSAVDFLSRVGDGLATAIPEAALRPGSRGRVLVVGADAASMTLEQITRIPVPGLHVCRLEPFRIGGSERFAVRWLTAGNAELEADVASPVPDFMVPEARRDAWSMLLGICQRIDPAVGVDGDRFSRRITWQGHVLGEVRVAEGALIATGTDGRARTLTTASDLRAFADQLMRRFAVRAGLGNHKTTASDAADASPTGAATRLAADGRGGPSAEGGDRLRSVLAAARLSPEEYSALGDPTSAVGGETESAATADDVARIVSAQENPLPPPRRPD